MNLPTAIEPAHPGPSSRKPGGWLRVGAVWLCTVAAAALVLRAADAVPRLALGLPRGVVRTTSLADLDRMSGRRMPVPAYYPDTLAWPPAETRFHTSGSAAIWCRARAGGGTALVVATAPSGVAEVAAAVLPPSVELQREAGELDSRPAIVSRVRDADGAVWHQVQWRTPVQIILVRYRGTLDELMKLAGSVND
jgi:hypothetical protein